MRHKFPILFASLAAFTGCFALAATKAPAPAKIYSIPVQTIEGKGSTLAEHEGKVMLVVNTASQCGFTPQYAGLEALHKKYQAQGLVVVAFPSNNFGGQEPGSNAEIKKFCELKYKTTFPLYSKVDVKKDPLFAYLQKETGETVGWNFGKFLVGRNGKVVSYFPSKVKPDSEELAKSVEQALHQAK